MNCNQSMANRSLTISPIPRLLWPVLALCVLLAAGALAAAPAGAAAGEPPEAPLAGERGVQLPIEPIPPRLKLIGTLNPNASARVGYHFVLNEVQNNDPICTGGHVIPGPEGEVEGKAIEVSATVWGGLKAWTTYVYCLVATNQYGETSSEPVIFKTPPGGEYPPQQAPTLAACGGPVTAGAFRVCGTLNPSTYEVVGYYFTYNAGTSCTGGRTIEGPHQIEGEAEPVSATLTGLQPGAQYTACLVATNGYGETSSAPLTFTTAYEPPIVLGESAESVTQTTATLQAKIDPDNWETSFYFQYSTSASLRDAMGAAGGSIPAASGERLVSAPLALAPDTTYYYRAVATSGMGSSEGPVESFTTPAEPVPSLAIPQGIGQDLTTAVAVPGAGGGEVAPATQRTVAPTNAQRLAKALKACQREPKRRRAHCRQEARKRYGTVAKGQ
jgi:hypothetical protein